MLLSAIALLRHCWASGDRDLFTVGALSFTCGLLSVLCLAQEA